MSEQKAKCEVEGCRDLMRANGMCPRHYQQDRLRRRAAGGAVCLTHGCPRPQKTRGCCGTHYQAYRRDVLAKKTTWRRLVDAGLVLKRASNGRKPLIGRARPPKEA